MRFLDIFYNLFKPVEKDDPDARVKRSEREIAESSTEDFLYPDADRLPRKHNKK